MTNRDRLISLVGFAPQTNVTDGALIDAGVSAVEIYTSANADVLKKVAIGVMQVILSTADTTTPDGMVIKYDRPSLLALIKEYKKDLGITDIETPIINSVSKW